MAVPNIHLRARPTLYKGIQMRSRLEADVAAQLDRQGFSWQYEPDCFADETGQYLPDFLLLHSGIERYVEVKPNRRINLPELDVILGRMSIIWTSKPDAHLELMQWDRGVRVHWIGFPVYGPGWIIHRWVIRDPRTGHMEPWPPEGWSPELERSDG